MPIEISEEYGGKAVFIQSAGKLTKPDYEIMIPELERRIRKCGKVRVLFDVADCDGWEAGAVWEDIKFDCRHFADVERFAMIGDKKWHHAMAIFCKPFTAGTVRYFDLADASEAVNWVEEGLSN